MKPNQVYLGKSRLNAAHRGVQGGYVTVQGESYYKITHVDGMPPFFISLVSDTDLWMFISSNGGLTAGRRNPDNALFPYYTDDKIHDSSDHTGSKTIVLVVERGKQFLWEPFSRTGCDVYRVERNLYKHVYGNALMFEEINRDLALTFRYTWFNSDKFGFVRRSQLESGKIAPRRIRVVDGIQNILPSGIDRRFQQEYSTLIDGYKKNELDPATGLALFTLSSVPIDRAEPSEALKTTVVWSAGLDKRGILLSARQLDAFRRGKTLRRETDIRAERGAYFITTEKHIGHGEPRTWYIAADVNYDAAAVVALMETLKHTDDLPQRLMEDVSRGTDNLVSMIASADGLQRTADSLACSRHFSNVLFNVMRGGIFDEGYKVDKQDFLSFVRGANPTLADTCENVLSSLPEKIDCSDLRTTLTGSTSASLERLGLEYLPLTFSRRHGDPSRPWNLFSIETKDGHGNRVLNYQGNWRDIFQNWEALALSYPEFVEGMIAKFANASTMDGYNPYRVTRDGFDWEVIDPHDDWSYVGYWGDHQVIYLAKLLEISSRYHPGRIGELLTREIFAYANVPYCIRSYESMLRDPHATIDFDAKLDREIRSRVQQVGTDGKLVANPEGRIVHVNLTEKLLVSVLAKLSSFIPEAGIWMNTQRPDWNDANNALVGNGVSMVTLYYLRRYLHVFRSLLTASGQQGIQVSDDVAGLLTSVQGIFGTFEKALVGSMTDKDRRIMMDHLGRAGTEFRNARYANGVSERKRRIGLAQLSEFFDLALRHIDHAIKANRREDNLYHAYNLLKVESDGSIAIRRLYEMLEGQVAVLSSGFLSPEASAHLLDALRSSRLYRKDQSSYLLYPDRTLARFRDKNNIPRPAFESILLLGELVARGNRQIVTVDVLGQAHFNSAFRNKNMLKAALDSIADPPLRPLVERDRNAVMEIYERLFNHQSFTGRSGTFYKYEGLGCIYWHMVSKLQLAVQETISHARQTNASEDILRRLTVHYRAIREGVGVHKSPSRYGAFPTDPYSHTPGEGGVQQPGMSGQVKEDIISRFGDLGVIVDEGKIAFQPGPLMNREFLAMPESFRYVDIDRIKRTITLTKGMLAFTLCQVPVVYHRSRERGLRVTWRGGEQHDQGDTVLDATISSKIFRRNGEVARLDVFVKLTP